MLTRQLSVGDHIFCPATYVVAVILKVNKKTYVTSRGTVTFKGFSCEYNPYSCSRCAQHDEWFECDDAQTKAWEAMVERYGHNELTRSEIEETKKTLAKAKRLLLDIQLMLSRLKDVDELLGIEEEQEEDEDDYEDKNDDFFDEPEGEPENELDEEQEGD